MLAYIEPRRPVVEITLGLLRAYTVHGRFFDHEHPSGLIWRRFWRARAYHSHWKVDTIYTLLVCGILPLLWTVAGYGSGCSQRLVPWN